MANPDIPKREGYTDAIKPASIYDMETPEAHRQRLLLNYRALMGE